MSSNEFTHACHHCGQSIDYVPYCMYCGIKQEGADAHHEGSSPQVPWPADDSEPLARIPFSLKVEQKIENKSKWMRFVAYTHYVAGGGLAIGALAGLISDNIVIRGLCFIIAGILIYQGRSLFKASHYFRLVAVTDEADQVYVAEGSEQMKSFFLLDSVFYAVILILLFFLEKNSHW